MEILVDKPELLGGSQTFIGVLITLLVLCLFHDKDTNFMLKIVINMIEDFLSSIAHSVDRMREELSKHKSKSKSEDLAFADYHWLNQSMRYPEIHNRMLAVSENSENTINEFVNSHQRHLECLKIIQGKVDKKNENELISHSMMLILMVVMTMDAIGVSILFGGVFMCSLILLSSIFYGYLWGQYLNFKNLNDVKYKTWRTRTLLRWSAIALLVSFLGWLFLTALTSLTFEWFLFWSALIFALPILAIAIFVTRNFKQSERYNKKFVTNHTLYILVVCSLLSFLVYKVTNSGLPSFLPMHEDLTQRWNSNISMFYHHIVSIRLIFILYAVLNSFFIPIFAVYSYYQARTLRIKLLMSIKKEKAQKQLSTYREEFVNLVHEMLAKEKDGAK